MNIYSQKQMQQLFALKVSREWLCLWAFQEKQSNFLFDLATLPGFTGVIFSYLSKVVTFVKHIILYQTTDKILLFSFALPIPFRFTPDFDS